MLSMDTENPDNGFYAGAKMAASFTIKSTKSSHSWFWWQ